MIRYARSDIHIDGERLRIIEHRDVPFRLNDHMAFDELEARVVAATQVPGRNRKERRAANARARKITD